MAVQLCLDLRLPLYLCPLAQVERREHTSFFRGKCLVRIEPGQLITHFQSCSSNLILNFIRFDASEQTTGVPGSRVQGYSSYEDAVSAWQYAQSNRSAPRTHQPSSPTNTSVSSPQTASVRPINTAPELPSRSTPRTQPSQSGTSETLDDEWYVVSRGAYPGVYQGRSVIVRLPFIRAGVRPDIILSDNI